VIIASHCQDRTFQWTAFVPYAARGPYEVHLYPRRRVPGLAALAGAARAEFCELHLDLLRRLDRLFSSPAPYISAWHQAPLRRGADDFALHLGLFTIRRVLGKLKYLAGWESGMGAFANDVAPPPRCGGQAPAPARLTAYVLREGAQCGDHGLRPPPRSSSP
jgi:galactose-1-phosphate uridylyltransferase